MTRIPIDDSADRPRVHAFIVGVGHYPYCNTEWIDGHFVSGKIKAVLRGIATPLTTASLSAITFAEWLANDPQPFSIPIGTIEVLISAGTPQKVWKGATSFPVERASFGALQRSCLQWYKRCNEHRENVAIFFWCGHGWAGWADEGRFELLADDIGEDEVQPFNNVVDFTTTHLKMNSCKAATQCFFIDACRTFPDGMDGLTQGHSRPLINVTGFEDPEGAGKDRPVWSSVAHGMESVTPPHAPSGFTEAVVKVLQGLGADGRSGTWRIETELLKRKLSDTLKWAGAKYPISLGGYQVGSSVLRVLDEPPIIPYRLGCLPKNALPHARWELHDLNSSKGSCPVSQAGEISAGSYQIFVNFPEGLPYTFEGNIMELFDTPGFEKEVKLGEKSEAETENT
ncbi:caspase family protein [Streptomyces sp. NPDC006314]|uniref:caspase family protein n=1 Tax=Streptomyces sp. NPDC006314 TaxID=3154475 RepID=UPI0033B5C9D1